MLTEYKKFISFKSIFYFCSLPLRLDSYRGCTIGCHYCFSKSINNRKERFSKVIPANPNKFERYFLQSPDEKRIGIVKQCVDRRIPFHFGCVSDPFQPAEKKYKITYEMLKIIRKYKYPTVLCTKSDLILDKEYLDVLKGIPLVVQISFSTFNDALALKLEPNAPSPSKRLKVLNILSQKGINTVVRLQPFLYPKETLDEKTISKISDCGVKHIVLEHLRIPTNSTIKSRNKLWNALDINMLEVYKKLGLKCSRINFELSSKEKYGNVLLAKKLAHKYGMSFGSGDNDFHHFSDDQCCCGVPKDEYFKNIYKGHLGISAYNSLRSNKFSCSNIDDEWQPTGSIKENLNSECRIAGLNDTKSLLNHKVSFPNSSNSPLSFYGIYLNNKNKYAINQSILKKIGRKQ